MARRSKKIRILLTGGGTGGHIYPLIAVARELNQKILTHGYLPDIRYFGDPKTYRAELEGNDVRVAKIVPSKWRRYFDLKNFLDIFRFALSLIQSFWKVFFFMPHAAFSKGGPGALAPVTACRFYAIPLVIHESDAVPGLTNKISAKSARLVELSFASARNFFASKKAKPINIVGNPVRYEILKGDDSRAAKAEFGLNADEQVVLFIGGSQGAERINDFLLENLKLLIPNFQILHQTGLQNFDDYKNQFDFLYKNLPDNLKRRYRFFPYFARNIVTAYAAADLVVARAGAGLIFELASLGKPSILVPIMESANNHQVQNAYEYEKSGAALVLEETNLLGNLVLNTILKILKDKNTLSKMSQSARKFYLPNAAQKIAEDILRLAIGG